MVYTVSSACKKSLLEKKILCNAGKRHSPQTDKEGSAREYIETLVGLAIKTYNEGNMIILYTQNRK